MNDVSSEKWTDKIREMFDELVGLPPGKQPDVDRERAKDQAAPHGTLTAPDAEALPPHSGAGATVN